MKAIITKTKPVKEVIEKVTLELSAEEARALAAVSDFHHSVAMLVREKGPRYCQDFDVINSTLNHLFYALTEVREEA